MGAIVAKTTAMQNVVQEGAAHITAPAALRRSCFYGIGGVDMGTKASRLSDDDTATAQRLHGVGAAVQQLGSGGLSTAPRRCGDCATAAAW